MIVDTHIEKIVVLIEQQLMVEVMVERGLVMGLGLGDEIDEVDDELLDVVILLEVTDVDVVDNETMVVQPLNID